MSKFMKNIIFSKMFVIDRYEAISSNMRLLRKRTIAMTCKLALTHYSY